MLFPTPEENKVIAGMLADCGGLEYDFHETLKDGRVMKEGKEVKWQILQILKN